MDIKKDTVILVSLLHEWHSTATEIQQTNSKGIK
jgi:hypothetical protein